MRQLYSYTGKCRAFRAKIQRTKKEEQYAFATVWTQGHAAKLDDILWVQVWGRGGRGGVGGEEEEEGWREQRRDGRDDSEHRTDWGGEQKGTKRGWESWIFNRLQKFIQVKSCLGFGKRAVLQPCNATTQTHTHPSLSESVEDYRFISDQCSAFFPLAEVSSFRSPHRFAVKRRQPGYACVGNRAAKASVMWQEVSEIWTTCHLCRTLICLTATIPWYSE